MNNIKNINYRIYSIIDTNFYICYNFYRCIYMGDKYLKIIENNIKKYYKTYFDYDYEKIIEICLKTYDEFKKQNPTSEEDYDFKRVIYYFILNLSFNLNEKDFNNRTLPYACSFFCSLRRQRRQWWQWW